MDFFMIVSLLGGLALFLYGMSMLGSGGKTLPAVCLEQTLEKLTNNVFKGVLLGALVTGAIQSLSCHHGYRVRPGQCPDSQTPAGHRHYHGRQYRYYRYRPYSPALGSELG